MKRLVQLEPVTKTDAQNHLSDALGKALYSLKDRVLKHKVPELLQIRDLGPHITELTTHFLERQNSLENLLTGISCFHLIQIKHFHMGGMDLNVCDFYFM